MSSNIRDKLVELEQEGVYFEAGYQGKDEVLVARMPDGSFIDFSWTESNDDGTTQFILPSDFERIVEETYQHYQQKD